MIEIKFPADRPDIALAMSAALADIAAGNYTVLRKDHAPSEVPAEDPKPLTSESSSHTEVLPTADTAAKCQTTSESVGAEPDPKPTSLFDEPSAGTAEAADETGTDQPTTQPEASPADASKLDLNGVAFNAAYCGEAAEPFYTTGKMRGQWKKKRGVEQDDYDAWYTAEQQKGGPTVEPEQPAVNAGSAFGASTPSVNSAAAFGGQQQAPAPEPEDDTPADAGSLMVWVSEKQAAGLITQEDVNAAWGAAGVASPADLFGPNAAEAVAAVFQHLKAKV